MCEVRWEGNGNLQREIMHFFSQKEKIVVLWRRNNDKKQTEKQ